jgi:hypothetical protein
MKNTFDTNDFTMSMSSSSKTDAVTHKKTSFLIEDILTTKVTAAVSQYDSPTEGCFNAKALPYSDINPIHGRLFTAAAALIGGTRVPAMQGHGPLMTSSTAALQRHLQAAAFYASTVATSQQTTASFDRSVSGPSPASVNTAYLFHSNETLPGNCHQKHYCQ